MSGSGFKKVTFGILAVLLITVWIRNLLLFVPATEVIATPQSGDDASRASIAPIQLFEDTVFTLDSNTRDPFLFPAKLASRQTIRTTPATAPRQIESIQASLMGHVFNAKQSHIIAFDSLTERTNLYQTGDSLNGFTLNKITRSEILWKSRKGRQIVWQTNP